MNRNTLVVLAALLGASGCGPTYYKVTDPTSGKIYYTESLEKQKSGGVRLRDAGTGRTVTLQNSEVQTVPKEEFESGKVREAAKSAEVP
jgi:hypothetical protein